jgi:predicted  nucleic acid-binding Zn-ribbon protein
LTPETGSSGDVEEGSAAQGAPPVPPSEPAQVPEAGVTPQAVPQVEGRRTQLRIVRENIESLSRDVTSFRKSHEASIKKLEAQIASIRKELAAHARSKDLGEHVKSHKVGTERLEKQVATVRNELASLKSHISKETARARAKEEAALSKILAKVSTKPAKPAKRPKKR